MSDGAKRKPRALTVVRTGVEHLTITEAHSYHRQLGKTDHKGAGAYVESYDPQCPLCRAELEKED